MKKILSRVVMAVAAVLLLSGCGINQRLTMNSNLNQTNVVLSQKNFHVVKTVTAEVSATYIFGIGGLSKQALQENAVAELTKKAGRHIPKFVICLLQKKISIQQMEPLRELSLLMVFRH